MNPVKPTSLYQSRLQVPNFLDRGELNSRGREIDATEPGSFARETYERTDRLAESIRLKLLKVLTLTLLRELEGVGVDRTRSSDKFDLQVEVQHFEAELIRSALIMTGGRQRRAAKLLGMKVTTLHSKIRRYGLTEVPNSESASGHEPSAVEAVRTSLELVEMMFDKNIPDSPEIHVTGEN
jgi:DNA-binding NtrC family response regulator